VASHGEKNERPFGVDNHLHVVRVGRDGKIVEEMRGPKRVKPSEIMERADGKFYIGTIDVYNSTLLPSSYLPWPSAGEDVRQDHHRVPVGDEHQEG
jgi:hypothetical protein